MRKRRIDESPKYLWTPKVWAVLRVLGHVEGEFRKWARSIDNLFITTFGREFIEILEYILEQEDTIEMTKMEEEFGSGTVTDIGDLEDKADQIHRVLLTLTSGETEDLMVGASNGFEAYRRVHRRWDPRTSGRKRNILRAILQPERVKTWTAVRPAIEQLEELIRRYEARRNASGARETLIGRHQVRFIGDVGTPRFGETSFVEQE